MGLKTPLGGRPSGACLRGLASEARVSSYLEDGIGVGLPVAKTLPPLAGCVRIISDKRGRPEISSGRIGRGAR